MEDVNWGVVTNGMDFLESSINHLAKGDERNLKYAALHLFVSMETLIKARLAREHWTLVLADVDARATSKVAYRAGITRSVTMTQALQRLTGVADVQLDTGARESIQGVERLRNRAAHFSMQGDSRSQVEVTVARGLNFLLHFIQEELRPSAPAREGELVDATLDKVRQTLGRIQALVQERMESIQPQLDGFDLALECPICRQPCLVVKEGHSARCLYCLYDAEAAEIAEAYAIVILEITRDEHLSGGVDWPVAVCDRCSGEAFISYIYTAGGDEIGSVCFSCGITWRTS